MTEVCHFHRSDNRQLSDYFSVAVDNRQLPLQFIRLLNADFAETRTNSYQLVVGARRRRRKKLLSQDSDSLLWRHFFRSHFAQGLITRPFALQCRGMPADSEARSRLNQRRFLRSRPLFSAFFELLWFLRNFQLFQRNRTFQISPFFPGILSGFPMQIFQDLRTFCKMKRDCRWISEKTEDQFCAKIAYFSRIFSEFHGISRNFTELIEPPKLGS